MAAFFDCDNDGDLDVYLVVNENIFTENPNRFRPIHTDGSFRSTGRLYRNDWDSAKGHGVFKNISMQAGITTEGYGHGAIICDINTDGWKDIYVTNDFLSDNLLYINNTDGTFTNRSKEYFKNTSLNAMGADMQDINNDGLVDIVELDMNPEDNYRKKMMMGANSYQTIQNLERYGYQYQYVRNTLQLNAGSTVGSQDSIGIPAFSQVAFLSGIAETDWSWAPLVTDFDNDGYRDIIVTNGYPKDVTDHDFMTYRANAYLVASNADILSQVPEVKLKKYAFRNRGDLTFENVGDAWGIDKACFSNGAAYADLDNDGDLDFIINNINDAASVYQNNMLHSPEASAFLQVALHGDSLNRDALGARIDIFYNGGSRQLYEQTPYRGYLSTVQNKAHFGLGKTAVLDSLVVTWPDAKKEVLKNVKTNQVLHLHIHTAAAYIAEARQAIANRNLFTEVTRLSGIDFKDSAADFIAFNIQKLLPHKLSEYGPALAAGDVDGNGLDDLVCGSGKAEAALFLQQPGGNFAQKDIGILKNVPEANAAGQPQNAGIVLFDADGDGDLDLYMASGGYREAPGSAAYQDRLYINDGKANFSQNARALPQNTTAKSCVRAADFDGDGDLDLFVGGRVLPWHYPKPVSSFLYRNDSKNGQPIFTDVTAAIASELAGIGMISDALFTDFNNDGWPDLLLAGEWMPLTFFKNEQGTFKNITAHTGVQQEAGWWNSLAAGDFDGDGDMDYVAGNLGLNSFYKASAQHPLRITAGDFNKDGNYDAFVSLYLPASQKDKTLHEFAANGRDDMAKQMVGIRTQFLNYQAYATAPFSSIFTPQQLQGALRLSATNMAPSYFENKGKGIFTCTPLPAPAQVAPLYGMAVDDFDGDGTLDIAINGNDFGTDVSVGRYDALNGLLLKGDGRGRFLPQTILESGLFIPGNGKALAALQSSKHTMLLAASQHNGPLKLFRLKKAHRTIALQPTDVAVTLRYKNGRTQKRETGWGHSFLSQSARFVSATPDVVEIRVINSKGSSRRLPL